MAKSALLAMYRNEPCPQCGAELVTHSGKHGPFLDYSHYPEHDYIRPLKSSADGHITKVLKGKLCPVCGTELVLKQGRFGMFTGCNDYPVCDHTELIDRPGETAIICPQCQAGHLVQRYSRYGKASYSYDHYSECRFVINFRPLAEECPECRCPLLIEKKTAQGVRHFCASKQCGKSISAEQKSE